MVYACPSCQVTTHLATLEPTTDPRNGTPTVMAVGRAQAELAERSDDVECVGVLCTECGWSIESADWLGALDSLPEEGA